MGIHYNRETEKSNRRILRRNATKAEKVLWPYLRNRNLLGIKFTRQYSVDQYIIDFYSPSQKLAVELDGEVHLAKEVKEHDEGRDEYLNRFGIKILRINNDLVLNDINKALELIKEKLIL